MEEVKIIKIGEIVRQQSSSTIMTIEEDYPIDGSDINLYLDVLRKSTNGRYNCMKTTGIIRQPKLSMYNVFLGINEKELSGFPDGDPIVGKSFTINNSSWHTSEVLEIIDDDMFITRNSVYLILTKSKIRDKKLKNLGI